MNTLKAKRRCTIIPLSLIFIFQFSITAELLSQNQPAPRNRGNNPPPTNQNQNQDQPPTNNNNGNNNNPPPQNQPLGNNQPPQQNRLDAPNLPGTPFDYATLNLPSHLTNNSLPNNLIGQNALIENDNTPAHNAITNAGATLGRVLFYDRNLSANGTVSCASCHQQNRGFADGRRLSFGFDGGATRRHSMSLSNARFYQPGKFFWDERAATLEDQVLMPFQDPVEMGLTLPRLVDIVENQTYYPALFAAAFGNDEVNSDRIALALAQFVRSLVSHNSRYDQGRQQVVTALDDFPGFSNEENQGKALFFNRRRGIIACVECHVSEGMVGAFDTGGQPVTTTATNNGLDAESIGDLGVYETTLNAGDIGKFKVPSLRNVARSAPYMHDGRFPNLGAVINHYSNGIENHVNLDPGLRGPNGQARGYNFNQQERLALIAFLNTLTDQAFLTDVKFSDPFAAPAGNP